MTYSEFTADARKYYWSCEANPTEDGRQQVDVLVYDTEEDMDADTDNSLAIDRETVIDDRS